ncbi:DUF4194 domain-containing protein [Peloplasma aerotolerans]|jgi:hypothetical protein|uniref:DUF4194 domain-containing protein n=1 Tax=Peloplasma aerotolerans TaxID=3044389 RepID=A0AAW6UFF1_9MOLU|nr:DUF4194 domain-containing protein [Mariniplasma sp. M4Ah]MDI6453733.1 DUF4194 domain-containing protein [Mariniplasma sp. M4Ah]
MNKSAALRQFSDEYGLLKEGEKSNFSRIVNKLFQVNFITKRKPGDTNDYRFIVAYKAAFESFFALSDFTLNIMREDEVVYIENDNYFNHMRLRKTESILILVIRILYQRKMDLITLDEDVEIYLHEIHSELTRIGYLDHKRITKDKLKPALTFLRNYNIIDYIDRGLHDDARIKIYPTILYVTNMDSIKEIIQKLEGYVEGGSDDDEETDED